MVREYMESLKSLINAGQTLVLDRSESFTCRNHFGIRPTHETSGMMPRRQSTMDNFLVGGEAAAKFRRDRWSARPLVEERTVLQALTEYECVDQNRFSCRSHRVLDEDEIPECKCQPGQDWTVTCGIGCENRSMQVECVRGKCVAGGHCSNQRMQDGTNVLLSVKKLPDKGMSLFACQQILPGTFVCQYTGEIIRASTYRRREREMKMATNFYGMATANNEVIDARAIGGLARFANHSCRSNCVVERWEVNGEICCGFFAKRLINNDEEITIDYGGGNTTTKRTMKCLCKASNCRGLIPM